MMLCGMGKTYSVQTYKNRANITVPAELVRAKGWEKGQKLKWQIKGDNKRYILKEGDDIKLQHNNQRYFVTMTIFQQIIDHPDYDRDYEFKWTVNSEGNLELIRVEEADT